MNHELFTRILGAAGFTALVASCGGDSTPAGGGSGSGTTVDASSVQVGDEDASMAQEGDAAAAPAPSNEPIALLPRKRRLSLDGGSHGCAVRPDHTLTCWGGPTSDQGASRFDQVVRGSYFWCTLDEEGRAACTGPSRPEQPPAGLRFKHLLAGSFDLCGVTDEGETPCWNSGSAEELFAGREIVEIDGCGFLGGLTRAGEVIGGTLVFDSKLEGEFVQLAVCNTTCGLMRNGITRCDDPKLKPTTRYRQIASSRAFGLCGIRESDLGIECSGEGFNLPGRFIEMVTTNEGLCGIHEDGSVACTAGIDVPEGLMVAVD